MKQDYRKQIEKIVKGMDCPRHLKCCKLGVKKLCKIRKIGIEVFLECWEKNPKKCKDSVPFGGLYFCECPVRWYIKNKLEK